MRAPVRSLPELLAPAGDMEKLRAAVTYGADAVYLGGPVLSLRTAGFDDVGLRQAVEYAHARNVRVYFCLNALPRQRHMQRVQTALDTAVSSAVDGLIIADPGVFDMARKHAPHLPIHLSTQANTANAAAVRFWKERGAARVNLARELSNRDIRDIMRAVPDMECELFVHGAMCMAVSGRCFLSDYMTDRGANLGRCSQPCRFHYKPTALAVEEKHSPGEVAWLAVEETIDESGDSADAWTSIFAAEELCLMRALPWIVRQGLHAIKIEGRMKSGGYTARVADAYATALRDVSSGGFAAERYLPELARTATRNQATGFFFPRRLVNPPSDDLPTRGVLQERLRDDAWSVAVKTPWSIGENVLVVRPGMERPMIRAGEYSLETLDGRRLDRISPGLNAAFRCDSQEPDEGLYLLSAGA